MSIKALHFIVSFFPHDRGASHSALRLARGLRERGVEVAFLVEALGPEWINGGTYEGFPVQSFPLTHPGKRRKLNGFLALLRFLRNRRGQVDLFHVHGGPYMNLLLAWVVGCVLRCPTLMKITLDGWDTPDGVRAGRHGRIALWLYRRLTTVVAMTSGQAETCRRFNIPARIEVIPNSVDVSRFQPLAPEARRARRIELGLPPDQPILAYAGYLGPVKGTDILFRVWHRLRDTFPDLHLLLAGNYMQVDPNHPTLEQFLARHDLPPEWANHPDVHQTGKLPDLAHHLPCADVFLFPSRQEGFGTVQIEAMACGLPCVVNDLPGVSLDIYPDPTVGFRVAGNDVDTYVRIITDLLRNPEQRARIGAAARARAESVFSVEAIAARYVTLYRETLARFAKARA